MTNNSYTANDSYMKTVSVLDNGLGADREKELSRIIKHSNNPESKQKAIEELVNGNLGLVLKCARDVYNGYHANLSLMDLITEGNFWLFYSARHFSYKKEARFSTYAYPIIRWHLWTAVNTDTLIHIPYNLLEYKRKFKGLKDASKGEVTNEMLMKEFKVLNEKAETIKDAFKLSMTSLDSPIGEESDTTLNDIIMDDQAIDPSIETDRRILKEYLEKIGTECLSDNEKKMIDAMFFAEGDNCIHSKGKFSYDNVSVQFGLTKERCRQIYERAMRKMRVAFFKEWDITHSEDKINAREVYQKATGRRSFYSGYKMEERYGEDATTKFYEKMHEREQEKGKKIFKSLL